MVTLAVALIAGSLGFDLAILARHVWSEIIAANLLAWPAALVLYVTGRPAGRRRRLPDYFFGIALAPSLYGLDLKVFSYRPSLIGLALMNLSFGVLQYRQTGTVTATMAIYQLMTFAYILNHFHFEKGVMFMWDIIEERFGWMLVWGDYVLVPFFYSLPAAYIAMQDASISVGALALICLAYLFGFWLFRGANGQKHQFKTDPSAPIWGGQPRTIGGRLLVSGFWGIGRKLNYSGEFLMYLSWTSLAGLASPVPYLLPAWLLALMLHRARRDDRRCRAKYGPLWEEYCRHVRFRMIPFVY